MEKRASSAVTWNFLVQPQTPGEKPLLRQARGYSWVSPGYPGHRAAMLCPQPFFSGCGEPVLSGKGA